MSRKTFATCKELIKGEIRFTFNYSTYDETEFNEIDELVKGYLKKREVSTQKYDTHQNEKIHWINRTNYDENDCEDTYYECSKCGQVEGFDYPFCPHCGSTMKHEVVFEWVDPDVENKERRLRLTQWRPLWETKEALKNKFFDIIGVEFDEESCSINIIDDYIE